MSRPSLNLQHPGRPSCFCTAKFCLAKVEYYEVKADHTFSDARLQLAHLIVQEIAALAKY
jgi:hypothetical protein